MKVELYENSCKGRGEEGKKLIEKKRSVIEKVVEGMLSWLPYEAVKYWRQSLTGDISFSHVYWVVLICHFLEGCQHMC